MSSNCSKKDVGNKPNNGPINRLYDNAQFTPQIKLVKKIACAIKLAMMRYVDTVIFSLLQKATQSFFCAEPARHKESLHCERF